MVIKPGGSGSRNSAAHPFDLFIVHAASDATFVRGYLLPALDLPSSRVLLIDELVPGALVVSEIERGVSGSRFTVVVLSGAYHEDRWAVFGQQLASHQSIDDVHVVPLRLADCKLPLHLEARISLDFTDRARWDSETARLRTLLGAAAPASQQIACPYPGMRPFAAHEADLFFGRDKELSDLIGRLDRGDREIYVIGPSGSGKSSLVQAGLRSTLSSGLSRLQRSFVVRTMRPGEHPTDRLANALEGDPSTPAIAVRALVERHPRAQRVLVFIDQLEELFTFADAAERQRFIATLITLRSETQFYVLFALRADFYGALMDSELWSDHAGISRLDVAPLRGSALVPAIIKPAMRVDVHLEARLCDRLVADAAAEPGALPLIQETLRLLWDTRRQQLLGLAEYEELGDGASALHIAITRHADATMRKLNVSQQAIAHRVLLRLVSFGEGRPDTRRQQRVQTLRSTADDTIEFSQVLQKLIDDRLLTIDGGEETDDTLVDLSHEALISAWPAFQSWIARRRADEQQRRRLEAKIDEWIERGRGVASLLDSVELPEAEHWMQSDTGRELGYGAELPALVAASRSEIEKVERKTQKARHFVGMTYLEQAWALLQVGSPLHALPYLVAARTEAVETMVLRILFAQASRDLPLIAFVGHDSSVLGAAFSPDGTRVITASQDRTARIWDVSTGTPVTPPLQHQGAVSAAAFSPDGTRVITASEDRTARVWDAMTGMPVSPPLARRGPITAVAFSPNGTRVIAASEDRTARVWDATTGKSVTPPLVHNGPITAAAFSPSGTHVITASNDETVRVWNATTGELVPPLLVHRGAVHTAAFSPDGTRVVTTNDNTVRVWDVTTRKPMALPLVHQDVVHDATFSPDGMRIVTASRDKTARVWDATTGKSITPPIAHRNSVGTAAFSPDGTCVVTASENSVRVWDAMTGNPVTTPREHQNVVHRVAFSPDGSRVVTASEDQTAQIWDATTSMPVITLLVHRRGRVSTAAFSPDGSRVVTASSDNTARIWDTTTGKPITPPLKHWGTVNSAAFSPDGTRVVTASRTYTARVWDAMTGKPVTPRFEHLGSVNVAAFSRDGTRVVTASVDHMVRVWDSTTGKQLTTMLGHLDSVNAAEFSPDDVYVVTASVDHMARVWNTATGKPVTTLVHQGRVSAAKFSPDGTRVLTASDDGTARIWNATTGKPVTMPLEHHGAVHAAAFSSDGTRVVTASSDKTARIWDAATGKPVIPALQHQGVVHAATFSPDGACVVTANSDKTAQIWDATTGKLVISSLEHQEAVHAATFSPDGMRVLTASEDKIARVWSIPIDMGTLEDWRLIARCSPFVLVNDVLVTNPDPLRVRPRC